MLHSQPFYGVLLDISYTNVFGIGTQRRQVRKAHRRYIVADLFTDGEDRELLLKGEAKAWGPLHDIAEQKQMFFFIKHERHVQTKSTCETHYASVWASARSFILPSSALPFPA